MTFSLKWWDSNILLGILFSCMVAAPFPSRGICSKTLSGCWNRRKYWTLHILCFFPFHLKEALYGFSLAFLTCQRHCTCALRTLLSKTRVTGTQAPRCLNSWPGNCDGCQCLTGRERAWRGSAGQQGDSWPGGAVWGGTRSHRTTQNIAQLKTYKFFSSGIFHLIFSDHSGPWVTEIMIRGHR